VIHRRHGQLAALPRYVVDDREYTLRRVLCDFPEPLLAALISGLTIHGDDLRCGTLFASHTSSCAAGAMIRELYADQFDCTRVQFLTRHRWRKRACSYGGTLATGMHASLLEAIFDRAVVLTMALHKDVSERTASRIAGRWILEEAERELGLREDRIAQGLPPIVSWRNERLRRFGEGMDRRLPQPVPAIA
jgi:hypothetical protein